MDSDICDLSPITDPVYVTSFALNLTDFVISVYFVNVCDPVRLSKQMLSCVLKWNRQELTDSLSRLNV